MTSISVCLNLLSHFHEIFALGMSKLKTEMDEDPCQLIPENIWMQSLYLFLILFSHLKSKIFNI